MLPERRFSLPPTSTSSHNEQYVREEGALSPAKFPSCASVLAALYKGLLSEIKQQSRQKLAGWRGGAEGGAGRALRRHTPSELPAFLSVLHSFQTLHSTSREVSGQTYTCTRGHRSTVYINVICF